MMKTKRFIVVTSILLLGCIFANAQETNKPLTRGSDIYGDLNGDGNVNVADVVTLVNLIMTGDEGDNDNGMTITGVLVRETQDHIVSSANTPGSNSLYLATYVGQNLSGIETFPTEGGTVKVDPNGYLLNGSGNVGMLYFTLNADNLDLTKCKFDLVNSLGEVFPVKLSDVAQSDYMISMAHGSTLDGDDLYKAKVTLDVEGVEKINADNLWDAGQEDSKVLSNFVDVVKIVATQGTNQTSIYKKSMMILQDFYNGTDIQRNKPQIQALRVSWADGKKTVKSDFDITCVGITPLGYKQIQQIKDVNMPWSLSDYGSTVGSIAKAVRSKTSSTTGITFKSVSLVDGTPMLTIEADETEMSVEVSAEVLEAVNNGMSLSTLESVVNSVLTPYQTMKNSDSSNILVRAQSLLSKAANSYITDQGGHVAWNAVEPVLLFNNANGISLLYPEMTINGDGAIDFIMTSMTDELIVPSYLKYIAVVQNGAVVDYSLCEGYEKVAQLRIPLGESEILYQVSDFFGNILTKRYPVNRTN